MPFRVRKSRKSLTTLLSLNLSCESLCGPSAGSGTLFLSYCDRGERSGTACGTIVQVPNQSLENRNVNISALLAYRFVPSRQAGNRQVAISLARVMLFRVGVDWSKYTSIAES